MLDVMAGMQPRVNYLSAFGSRQYISFIHSIRVTQAFVEPRSNCTGVKYFPTNTRNERNSVQIPTDGSPVAPQPGSGRGATGLRGVFERSLWQTKALLGLTP